MVFAIFRTVASRYRGGVSRARNVTCIARSVHRLVDAAELPLPGAATWGGYGGARRDNEDGRALPFSDQGWKVRLNSATPPATLRPVLPSMLIGCSEIELPEPPTSTLAPTPTPTVALAVAPT